MSYFYLILQAVIFSFGGLMIKASGTMISPMLLSFLRFLIGVALLLLILKIRSGRIRLTLVGSWIILGGIAKAIHYVGENYGVMQGASYGGIIVWPVQTLVVLLVSIFVYKERITLKTALGTLCCIGGISLVTWNGKAPEVFFQSQASALVAFILAGTGAACFSIAQKHLVKTMNIVEMNASMFFYGMLTSLLVLPPTGPHTTGAVNMAGIFSITVLGIITCVGFLLQAAAIKTVPLLIATIIQSSTVLLTILWGVLFYGDSITGYVVAGTVFFLAGIIVINLRQKKA